MMNIQHLKIMTTGLLLWITLFLGNAKIYGIPLIVGLPLLFIIYIILIPHCRINKTEIFLLTIGSSILALQAHIVGVSYNIFYPTWVVSFFFGFIIAKIIINMFIIKPFHLLRYINYVYLGIYIILFIGAVWPASAIDGRANFIFGPNMLYRVFIFFSVLLVGQYMIEKKWTKGFLIIILTSYIFYKLGSRGGVLSSIILIIAARHAMIKRINIIKELLLIGAIALIISSFNYKEIRVFDFSPVKLDSTNFTEAYSRLKPYYFLIYEPNRLKMIGTNHMNFSKYFGSEAFQYPHNIFLELIMFYGILGIVVSLYLAKKLIILFTLVIRQTITPLSLMVYALIGAFIGTLISGDLGDNGVYIGLFIGINPNIIKSQWL